MQDLQRHQSVRSEAEIITRLQRARIVIFETHITHQTPHFRSRRERVGTRYRAMATNGYMHTNGPNHMSYRIPSSQTISPSSQNGNDPFDTDLAVPGLAIGSERSAGTETSTALLMRKLPRHTTTDSLRTMLLFAKDFDRADLVSSSPQDQGYLTAIARFRTSTAAEEARALLHGKQNNPKEPPLHVEFIRQSPGGGLGSKRNASDTVFNRANSGSSTGSSSGQLRQSSRFNNTFQAMDPISPPKGAPGLTNGGSFSSAEGPDIMSPHPYFSPQSPIGQVMGDRQRLSGKAIIGEDGIDDEPGDLLKDPVAFAKSDMTGQLSRHPTNPQLPTSRFAGLALSTNTPASPPMSSFTSARSSAPIQSPTSAMSPSSMGGFGPNVPYQLANQHHQRHNYPPVNPADQNPPCNTLYVGNLPIDTSEDELKAMFSKQRGYKRLCFRTKQNGPMCFVEFDDTSAATKALNELYGHPLHNSVKGGIRLSFSKNPLGVRSGQAGGMGSPTPLSPTGPMLGMNGLGIAPFSTANGPPPGLAAPPGLNSPIGSMNGMINPTSMGGTFAMSMGMGMNGMRHPQASGMTAGWGGQAPQYSYDMYGR